VLFNSLDSNIGEYVLVYFTSFIAVAFVLTLHEFAHSFVAYKCGDPTPKNRGRLSLNPLRHFDILGLVCFVFAGFGWARPIPVNPSNFKNFRGGLIATSLAGIIMNLITAFLFYPLVILSFSLLANVSEVSKIGYVLALMLFYILRYVYIYSLSFAVFNLLPLPPLDGFNFIEALFKGGKKIIGFLRRYGNIILIILIAESFVCDFIANLIPEAAMFDVLGYVLSFAENIVGWPIVKFWGLIFEAV